MAGAAAGRSGRTSCSSWARDNFYYDGRGNQTVKDAASSTYDRTIKYSIDDQAYEAVSGTGVRTRFWYGSDGARYKRDDDGKKTLYLGNVEIVTQGAVTTIKRTIAGVMLQTVIGATATNYYLFHDQLGSLVKITNATGGVVSSQDYAALGYRRDVDTQYSNGGTVPALTTRGFTGHEMVDGVLNLIHMNGRIFDPGIGRFLQADPVIQAPGNAQSWNAYSYVLNNPLTYTDPTGMMSIGNILKIAAIIVVSYFTAGWAGMYLYAGASAAEVGVGLSIVAAGGFVAGYIGTGTLKGGVRGAFGAVLTAGVGMAFGEGGQLFAQALSGGIVESLNGGNFGNGFFAAGLTAAFMPQVGKISNDVGRTVTAALVGGTISEATGGKFANGAVSGAIQAAMAGGSSEGVVPEKDASMLKYDNDVYGNESLLSNNIGGIQELPSGLAYSIYDDSGTMVVAFRGSEHFPFGVDWRNNYSQALGLGGAQYQDAVMIATQLQSIYGDNLIFTGHSLGGGLASVASLATGLPAVTFNAAGVSRRTLSRLGLASPSGNASTMIRSYKSTTDILSGLQAMTPLPNALGNQVWIRPAGLHGIGGLCHAVPGSGC